MGGTSCFAHMILNDPLIKDDQEQEGGTTETKGDPLVDQDDMIKVSVAYQRMHKAMDAEQDYTKTKQEGAKRGIVVGTHQRKKNKPNNTHTGGASSSSSVTDGDGPQQQQTAAADEDDTASLTQKQAVRKARRDLVDHYLPLFRIRGCCMKCCYALTSSSKQPHLRKGRTRTPPGGRENHYSCRSRCRCPERPPQHR